MPPKVNARGAAGERFTPTRRGRVGQTAVTTPTAPSHRRQAQTYTPHVGAGGAARRLTVAVWRGKEGSRATASEQAAGQVLDAASSPPWPAFTKAKTTHQGHSSRGALGAACGGSRTPRPRRVTCWGHRGERVGEASHPGPPVRDRRVWFGASGGSDDDERGHVGAAAGAAPHIGAAAAAAPAAREAPPCRRHGCPFYHLRGERRHGFCCNGCHHNEANHTDNCQGAPLRGAPREGEGRCKRRGCPYRHREGTRSHGFCCNACRNHEPHHTHHCNGAVDYPEWRGQWSGSGPTGWGASGRQDEWQSTGWYSTGAASSSSGWEDRGSASSGSWQTGWDRSHYQLPSCFSWEKDEDGRVFDGATGREISDAEIAWANRPVTPEENAAADEPAAGVAAAENPQGGGARSDVLEEAELEAAVAASQADASRQAEVAEDIATPVEPNRPHAPHPPVAQPTPPAPWTNPAGLHTPGPEFGAAADAAPQDGAAAVPRPPQEAADEDHICWLCGTPGGRSIMALGDGVFCCIECRDEWHDQRAGEVDHGATAATRRVPAGQPPGPDPAASTTPEPQPQDEPAPALPQPFDFPPPGFLDAEALAYGGEFEALVNGVLIGPPGHATLSVRTRELIFQRTSLDVEELDRILSRLPNYPILDIATYLSILQEYPIAEADMITQFLGLCHDNASLGRSSLSAAECRRGLYLLAEDFSDMLGAQFQPERWERILSTVVLSPTDVVGMEQWFIQAKRVARIVRLLQWNLG